MRNVERAGVKAPASLTGPGKSGASELVRARTFFGGPVQYDAKGRRKSFNFKAYKEDDVRHTLQLLFHSKCAYCEASYEAVGPVDIEHFRPKGEVEGEPAHQGYWWLAADWGNLLPSCIDCNRRRFQPTPRDMRSLTAMADTSRTGGAYVSIKTGKDSCFPVEGARVMAEPSERDRARLLASERALLLNPCEDRAEEHLRYWIDRRDHIGLILPVTGNGVAPALPALTDDANAIIAHAQVASMSIRGALSIQVFGLNRLALVQERTRLLRRLEFLGALLVDASTLADDLEDALPQAGTVANLIQAAIDRLRAMANRTMAEIVAMADPRAPFSELVREWIAVFKDEL
ncbi:hypothetical protein AB4Z10_05105 [Bosea sp. RAF48]|uniref:hypothetical protein n=1 Tax=Bosea sp. RAF48 TaxID=3237480 RepID=UPI003F8F4490